KAWRGWGTRRELEVLLCPLVEAFEGLLQVFEGIGHTEAQVAFAKFAEGRAGKPGDSSLIEQSIGQRLGLPSRLRNVREDVECALGLAATESLDLVQSSDENFAAVLELGAHVLDRTLIPGERLDTRNLGEAGGAGVGIG